MSENTPIEWATHSFSPWIGCTKVSPGCSHCYAVNTTRARVLRSQGHETWGKGKARSRTSAATWRNPLKWNRDSGLWHTTPRPRVFPSLCDWLDDEVPIEWLADFLKLIHVTRHLDWQLLTKRPENFQRRITEALTAKRVGMIDRAKGDEEWSAAAAAVEFWRLGESPLGSVWIGTSVEDQKRADERIPELLKIPANVRFLSVEPLLGQVDVASWGWRNASKTDPRVDWVIVGGESGPGARPCNVEWIRDIVRQCKAAGVPCFVKQFGSEWATFQYGIGRSPSRLHPKGGNPSEWPEDLRVREFPTVRQEQSRSSAPQS